MFTPEKMVLAGIVVPREKAEETTTRLLRLGILHPVDIRDIEREITGLSPDDLTKEQAAWEELNGRLKTIVKKLGPALHPAENTPACAGTEAEQLIADAEVKVNPLAEKKERLLGELAAKEDRLAKATHPLPFPIPTDQAFTYLETAAGTIEEKNIPLLEKGLAAAPHLFSRVKTEQGRTTGLLVYLKKDRDIVEPVLKDLNWEPESDQDKKLTLSPAAQDDLKREIREDEKELAAVKKEIEETGRSLRETLAGALVCIDLHRSLLRAKKYACATERTMTLAGWIPAGAEKRLRTALKAVAPDAYVETTAPEDLSFPMERVPVHLAHSVFLRPFQTLVTTYGLPRYGSFDPTVFVAASFTIMFGVMFGDLGQGLVLALTGLFLLRSKNEALKQAALLLVYCGSSSAVFGLLFGSVFGLEELLPALWLKPMDSISRIFQAAIYFGIGLLTFGIIVNVVMSLRNRDYVRAFFDNAGLIAGVVYWAGIGLVVKSFFGGRPPSPVFIALLAGGLVLLFFKPLAESFAIKRSAHTGAGHESGFIAYVESGIDLMEIIMGYLANTVSFIRMAAFTLAHVGLFFAVFELEHLIHNTGHHIMAVSIVVLGNIGIILLEGMVVSIQSLRLHYYEFFSKFFSGGEEKYKPLTL